MTKFVPPHDSPPAYPENQEVTCPKCACTFWTCKVTVTTIVLCPHMHRVVVRPEAR